MAMVIRRIRTRVLIGGNLWLCYRKRLGKSRPSSEKRAVIVPHPPKLRGQNRAEVCFWYHADAIRSCRAVREGAGRAFFLAPAVMGASVDIAGSGIRTDPTNEFRAQC
jgi:hypothetical protein